MRLKRNGDGYESKKMADDKMISEVFNIIQRC